jgi:flagellar L-ring protein precursor FlgH
MNKRSPFRFEPRRSLLPRRRLPSRALAASALLLFSASLSADSLWHEGESTSMCADKRAGRVGDLVTILVQESSTATKDHSTSTSKKSGIDAAIKSFFYSPTASGLLTKGGTLPALSVANASTFDGSGKINNSQQIVASVAVRVVDVLPNKNLIIEGTRESSFSGEEQKIILRGTIRANDIMANNTVYSYNVADATIKFVSKGTLNDTQRKGWLHRVWDKVSPF